MSVLCNRRNFYSASFAKGQPLLHSAAIFSTNNGSSGSLSLAVASLIPGNVLTSSGYVEYQYVHSH